MYANDYNLKIVCSRNKPGQNSVRIRYSFDPRGESILLVNAADIK